MTNAMIILLESVKLMEEGILKSTGQKIVVEDAEGKKKELDVPEQIHTYARWKSLGYQVKKGEKAVVQFPIWKYISRKAEKEAKEMTEEQAAAKGYCYMKTASFFTVNQVERKED